MRIVLEPVDYPHGERMKDILTKLFSRHPLDPRRQILTPELVGSITLKVRMTQSWPPDGPRIDRSGWPRRELELSFGSGKYVPQQNEFKEELFWKDICHEVTHIIDRLDGSFGLGMEASDTPSRSQFDFEIHLWHCYIDGRLERAGNNNPYTLQERMGELPLNRPWCVNPGAARQIVCTAWDAKSLTYGDIRELARQLDQCYVSTR
jgi:hypothetical protein